MWIAIKKTSNINDNWNKLIRMSWFSNNCTFTSTTVNGQHTESVMDLDTSIASGEHISNPNRISCAQFRTNALWKVINLSLLSIAMDWIKIILGSPTMDISQYKTDGKHWISNWKKQWETTPLSFPIMHVKSQIKQKGNTWRSIINYVLNGHNRKMFQGENKHV